MTRKKLLSSPEYWILEIQMQLYKIINDFMENNNINRTQLADKLGVTKGYISQILNGDFDHRISKLVELALSVGKVPRIKFEDLEQVLIDDNS
jgi:transcriptional regulator with XRE-family HTH domain